MGFLEGSRPNMTDDQIWQQIVRDCQNTYQKTINCGSALRRKAILEMDRRLKEAINRCVIYIESRAKANEADMDKLNQAIGKGVESIREDYFKHLRDGSADWRG